MPSGNAPLTSYLSQGTLSNYEPSWRDKAAYWLAQNWYGDNREGVQKANRLMNVADVTPVGIPLALDDAARAFGRGNYAGGAVTLAMAGIPAVRKEAKLTGEAAKEVLGNILEKHGLTLRQRTPHSIDAMVDDKNVGTLNISENHPYVSSAFLEPGYRNQGIGKALYAKAEELIGRHLVPSPLGLSDDAKQFWKKRLAKLEPDKAKSLIEESRQIGRGYGIKDADIDTRLNDLDPRLSAILEKHGLTQPKTIKAYHGSPHSFDKFDMSKIGTGEGAQAYGHGLYFAENEGVAKSYRDTLSKQPFPDGDSRNGAYLMLNQRGEDAARQYLAKDYPPEQVDQMLADIKSAQSGHMYEVQINADPDQFLDWDKPLSEQPHIAQKLGMQPKDVAAIKAKIAELEAIRPFTASHTAESEEYIRLLKELDKDPRGSSVYQQLARESVLPEDLREGFDARSPYAASKALRDKGIPGIKYLDAGSRGKGDGTRNYVVTDERLITILRKYGLLPPMLAGVAMGASQDQQQ